MSISLLSIIVFLISATVEIVGQLSGIAEILAKSLLFVILVSKHRNTLSIFITYKLHIILLACFKAQMSVFMMLRI